MTTVRLLLLSLCLLIGSLTHAQDRAPNRNVIYPEAAFSQFQGGIRVPASGRVIDVTRPPFNAAGDGVTDDTRAIRAAYTFVAEQFRDNGWYTDSNNEGSYLLYFPDGTYLVSNTLIHNLDNIPFPDAPDPKTEGVAWIRFVGQSRDNTIIRLKDNSPGFEAGANKEVVSFQKKGVGARDGNNIPAANQISDLTINVGSGNPGATGLYFMSANNGEMSNLLIKSEDGQGYAGIDLPEFSVQGHYRDITVEGFDYGIRATNRGESNPTFEYLTLRNQNTVGVLVNEGGPILRRVESVNSVPFATVNGNNASVVLLDSRLRGGSNGPAIDLLDIRSQLFARNVQVGGYNAAVRRGGSVAVSGNIDEYTADQVYTLFDGTRRRSLNLPVAESPLLDWEQDLSQWANVDTYPGANDTERVQNAMNSGKPVVYFPKSRYVLNQPIEIPASVRHIDFLYSRTNGSAEFIIRGGNQPLFIDHTNRNRSTLTQSAPRTVVVRNATFDVYRYTSSEPSELFLEGTAGFGSNDNFCPPPLTTWARSINHEPKNVDNFRITGGTLWTMGFKTESARKAFEVTNGSTVEVLGGLHNQAAKSSAEPMVFNDNSNVSFIGYTHLVGASDTQANDPYAIEVRDGVRRTLTSSQLPARGSRARFIPLYVGVTEGFVPPGRQVAYQGPHSLPGVIEMEYYDEGGPGVAFNETSTKQGSTGFRPQDPVDVTRRSNASGEGTVGFLAIGEWLEYTLADVTAGEYKMRLRYSSESESRGSIAVSLDGQPLGTLTSAETTASWDDYATVSRSVNLLGGNNQVLRVTVLAGGIDLDAIEFVPVEGGSELPPPLAVEVGARVLYGTAGDLVVMVDDVEVDTLRVNTAEFASYRTSLPNSGNVKLFFVDNPNTNLEVDYLTVGGVKYEAEAQAVNTSAWNHELQDCGLAFSQKMHCRGFIDFGSLSASARQGAVVSKEATARLSDQRAEVYPNPSTGRFTVSLPQAGSVRIIDLQGRTVYEQWLGSGRHALDLSSYKAGMYVLSTDGMESTQQFKLMIE